MPQVLNWIADHWLMFCGIGVTISAIYQGGKIVTKIVVFIHNAVVRTVSAENTLHKVATNHLPHIQKELEDVNHHLAGLREDMRRRADAKDIY